ncbi:MAG TPA: helix-hairpin-helix domain-containing protein [Saprospiraceae bacterium]|nr:helix-hairpin-helix domain-containing protein [Saprospiraceae bacterium]
MLNNKQIANQFDLLAKLMELHDENPFKIRSYANAYLSLRKLEGDLSTMGKEAIASIPGVGNAIADKIEELVTNGQMALLQKYKEMTPSGIQEMLSIKGLGPKKVKQIWKEMEITTIGELLYACNENRLVSYKGFGEKLQDEIKSKIEYFMDARGKFLYAHVIHHGESLVENLGNTFPDQKFSLCGELRRKMPEVGGIEILTDLEINDIQAAFLELNVIEENGLLYYQNIPVSFYHASADSFYNQLFNLSGSESFLEEIQIPEANYQSEEAVFNSINLQYIPVEYRETKEVISLYQNGLTPPQLIEVTDIKGIIHNHSTYSDGLHSLEQMSDYVKAFGYEYFVISDHSKSAGYAGGLQEDRVVMQWREIDSLNLKYNETFRVYKSIESDILSDGSLDYSEDLLKEFDLVIASVHSVLNMDIDRATSRLIKAIENPYTRILGHPTGRLLLARAGYPIDYKKVIDACAANGVVMELNANPQRLDIDWTWISYCMEKDVLVSINPDAHSKESIHYVKYGVEAARKGGLTKKACLCAKSRYEFDAWLSQK